jgi:hypothetical protein
LGGTDLCEAMDNWGGKEGPIKHAIIIKRENQLPTIEEANSADYSRFIFKGDEKY